MPLRMYDPEKERREEDLRRKAGRRKGSRGSKRSGPGGVTGRVAQPGPRPGNTPPPRPGLGQVARAQEPKSPRQRMDEKKAEKREEQMVLRRLSGGQAKLDKNKNKKIDAEDFKILRAEKAKGRGQGLQDEKMKPGKVMKARKGDFIKRRMMLAGKSDGDTSFDAKKRAQDMGIIDKKTGKGRTDFIKKAKSVKFGKRLLIPIAIGIAGVQALKSKMKKKKEEPKKKMGGGMMKRPMYNKGGGADMSKEPTSKMKASETARTYALAQSMKDKDRLTERDIDMAKKAIARVKAKRAQQGFLRTDPMPKKMGGGMMKRYNKGDEVRTFTDPKTAMIAHSLKTKDKIGENERRTAKFLEKRGAPGIIKDGKINRSRNSKGSTRIKKDFVGKMGGGMMQRPMGMMKKGSMVKARGGGMARTKPTKMF